MKNMILGTAVIVAFAAFAAAQPGEQNQQQTGDQQQSGYQQGGGMNDAGGNAGMTGGAQSDASLAATIKAINDTEVKAGRIAEKRGRSKAVKNFARMMVREHGSNNQQLAMVEKRIGLQPAMDESVTAMKDQAKQDVQALESSSGTDFDKAYIDQMVKGHEDALKKLDDAISNNAGRNEQLSSFLTKTRQTISRHLDQARKLQSESGSGTRSNEGGSNDNNGGR